MPKGIFGPILSSLTVCFHEVVLPTSDNLFRNIREHEIWRCMYQCVSVHSKTSMKITFRNGNRPEMQFKAS